MTIYFVVNKHTVTMILNIIYWQRVEQSGIKEYIFFFTNMHFLFIKTVSAILDEGKKVKIIQLFLSLIRAYC